MNHNFKDASAAIKNLTDYGQELTSAGYLAKANTVYQLSARLTSIIENHPIQKAINKKNKESLLSEFSNAMHEHLKLDPSLFAHTNKGIRFGIFICNFLFAICTLFLGPLIKKWVDGSFWLKVVKNKTERSCEELQDALVSLNEITPLPVDSIFEITTFLNRSDRTSFLQVNKELHNDSSLKNYLAPIVAQEKLELDARRIEIKAEKAEAERKANAAQNSYQSGPAPTPNIYSATPKKVHKPSPDSLFNDPFFTEALKTEPFSDPFFTEALKTKPFSDPFFTEALNKKPFSDPFFTEALNKKPFSDPFFSQPINTKPFSNSFFTHSNNHFPSTSFHGFGSNFF